MTTNCHSDGELTPMLVFEYIANMTHDTRRAITTERLTEIFGVTLYRMRLFISKLRGAGLLRLSYGGDAGRGFCLTEYALTSPELQEALQHADKYQNLRWWEW